jgi:hypothetical protein
MSEVWSAETLQVCHAVRVAGLATEKGGGVDKVHKQPIAHTEQTQTSHIQNINQNQAF